MLLLVQHRRCSPAAAGDAHASVSITWVLQASALPPHLQGCDQEQGRATLLVQLLELLQAAEPHMRGSAGTTGHGPQEQLADTACQQIEQLCTTDCQLLPPDLASTCTAYRYVTPGPT